MPAALNSSATGQKHFAIGGKVPAVVGGGLFRAVGHQRHLMRLVFQHQVDEVAGRVALDVELRLREFIGDQAGQVRQVGETDVALIRAG